ncbi:MAG: porin family protein [Ginsengibacter sp.]
MKNKILLLICILSTAISFAQKQPTFGVRGGINSTSMRGDAVTNLDKLLNFTNGMVTTQSSTGFFGGGYVSIPLAGGLSVEPAVYYALKGYELRGALNIKGLDILNANAKAQLQSQYIDIPVLLKANVGGLQFFAGPQFSYLAKADLRTTAGVLGINLFRNSTDATSQFNRWDAALTGGLGYQFTNGINIMASYDYGLSKVDANKKLNSYNQGFKVGFGIGL